MARKQALKARFNLACVLSSKRVPTMERSGGGSELRFQRWCLLGLPINPGALPQADDECCAFGQTYMDSAEFNPSRWWSRHRS